MAVRLNKALKELNIGIAIMAEYLQKRGMALEDASPNAKITDEQFAMLMKEFGTDKNAHAKTETDIMEHKEGILEHEPVAFVDLSDFYGEHKTKVEQSKEKRKNELLNMKLRTNEIIKKRIRNRINQLDWQTVNIDRITINSVNVDIIYGGIVHKGRKNRFVSIDVLLSNCNINVPVKFAIMLSNDLAKPDIEGVDEKSFYIKDKYGDSLSEKCSKNIINKDSYPYLVNIDITPNKKDFHAIVYLYLDAIENYKSSMYDVGMVEYKGEHDIHKIGNCEIECLYALEQTDLSGNIALDEMTETTNGSVNISKNTVDQIKDKKTSMEINYIKFNNFRRFTNFPKLELGKVNMFVGKNNSGKSTTVKGMLLMMNFLKDGSWAKGQIFPYFSFGGDVSVASFGRALNVNAHERNISFGIGIGEFSVDVVVTGENNSPTGNVTKIVCDYNTGEYIFSFDFINGFSLVINDKPIVDEDKLTEFREEKQKLEMLIADPATKIAKAALYKEQLKSVENYLESNAAKTYEYEIPAERVDVTGGSVYLVESLIRVFCQDNIVPNTSKKNKVLLSRANVINNIAKFFNETIRKTNIERVYSHSASQTTVFNVNDRNDYVAQCIHGFAEQRISQEKGDLEYALLTKWMDKFEIGVGYSIDSVENEAYTLKIKGQDGSLINLGDKGKGSIQVMTLLMRLITISKKYRTLGENVVVLVEEPEQNLHPKTQSFLADLFYDFSVYYGLSFIIETHSEYLIRRNQIIVARGIKEGDFTINSCPIKVTYFPLNAPVYNMPFMYNGHFARFFESGFFDEASLLANEVLSYEEEPQIDDEE